MTLDTLAPAALRALLRDERIAEPYRERVRDELARRGEGEAKPAPASTVAATRPQDRATASALGAAPVLRFTLWGPPRTKKTSNRLAWRGGKPKVLPSLAWTSWLAALHETGQLPWSAPLPDRPYQCRATFWRHADVGDLVGYQQGLADVLEEGGVISNDKWLRSWDGTRLEVCRACPRVEVELSPLP